MDYPCKILKPGDPSDLLLLSEFIELAGDSLSSFRYYNKRTFDVLINHLYTVLFFHEGTPVAYGHLDNENGTTWLGIAVVEKEKGKGLGKKVMENLLEEAAQKKYPSINLSVDKDNTAAIALYKKYGFNIVEDLSPTVYLMNYTQ